MRNHDHQPHLHLRRTNRLVGGHAVIPGPRRVRPGYDFTNFEGPNAVSTVVDGINNNGTVVGQATDCTGNTVNFVRNPDGTFTTLTTLPAGDTAFGINSSRDCRRCHRQRECFLLSTTSLVSTLIPDGRYTRSVAFGINDKGNDRRSVQHHDGNDPGLHSRRHQQVHHDQPHFRVEYR